MFSRTLVAANNTLDALLTAALASALAALRRTNIAIQDGAHVCRMLARLDVMMLVVVLLFLIVTGRRLMLLLLEVRHLILCNVLELVQVMIGAGWRIALHCAEVVVVSAIRAIR